MAIPAFHYVSHLWDDDDIPFDESLDRPLTTSQLHSFLQDSERRLDPRSRQYTSLCAAAIASVKSIDQQGPDPENISHVLRSVIKPLFSSNPHAALTAEGRKSHYQNTTTNLDSKYDTSLFSPEAKPWKHATKWALPLLTWVLHQISLLPDVLPRQNVISSSSSTNNNTQNVFSSLTSLLAPPILHLIDDSSLPAKALGASLLSHYCDTLSTLQSDPSRSDHPSQRHQQPILVRTGLNSVFIDALTPNLSLLPTLTPESESLFVLRRIYPAYISILEASSPWPSTTTTTSSSPLLPNPDLQTLTAHTLNALTHIQPPFSYPSLQTFLLTQLSSRLVPGLGPSIAPFLQRILPPTCREVLCDPFGGGGGDTTSTTITVPVQRAAVAVCKAVCAAVPERIRPPRRTGGAQHPNDAGWWSEILRGAVGCWVVVVLDADRPEEAGGANDDGGGRAAQDLDDDDDDRPREPMADCAALKRELKELVGALRDVVGDGEMFEGAVKVLVEEEEGLKGLYFG